MKIFVTGATGIIGGAVLRALREKGHEVVALARSAEAAAKLAPLCASVVRGDVTEPASFASALRDVDGIVHNAVGMKGGVNDSDVLAVSTMIDALAGTDRPLVVTSGIGVYFGLPDTYVDEETPLDRAIPSQVARVKLEEHVVRGAERGVRAIVLRPAHVYGRGQAGVFTRVQLAYARREGAAAYIGEGGGFLSFVHVDDLAEAYVAALAKGRTGARYNVVASTLTTREVATAVSHAVGAEGRTVSIAAADATAAFGPLGPLLERAPVASSLRAARDLAWTARSPSFQWEAVHGSLRDA